MPTGRISTSLACDRYYYVSTTGQRHLHDAAGPGPRARGLRLDDVQQRHPLHPHARGAGPASPTRSSFRSASRGGDTDISWRTSNDIKPAWTDVTRILDEKLPRAGQPGEDENVALLKNEHLLGVWPGRRLRHAGEAVQVGGGRLVLMLNPGNGTVEKVANWMEVPGLWGGRRIMVREVWMGEGLGCVQGGCVANVSSRDTAAVLVGKAC
ncbi:MAG: hypothetical protein LQ340_003341 [Diploschistes diacapsis]|nr:MAG: hypothetical protein LQ340_003341 [Diploschistes diacapsis]